MNWIRRQLFRLKTKYWAKKHTTCTHRWIPACYNGMAAKACIDCNTFMNVSRQEFRHLFKISFPQLKRNYEKAGKKMQDLKELEG